MSDTLRGKAKIHHVKRRLSIRAIFISSMSGTIYATCLTSTPVQLFALKLGASNLYLGLMTFVILMCGLFSLTGISAIEKKGKRAVLAKGWLITVLILTPFILIPFLAGRYPQSHSLLLWIMIGLFCLRSVSEGYSQAGWFPVLQDNVPSRITGKFFASLRIYWQSAVLITVLLISFLLGKDAQWWKYEVIFAIGLVNCLIRYFTIFFITEKPVTPELQNSPDIITRLKDVLKDNGMMNFLGYIFTYNIPAFITLPFQIKYLKTLGYSEGYILLATSMLSLGAILSLKFWGKLADKFGNRSIFTISHIGMMATALLWLFVGENLFSRFFVIFLYLSYTIFNSGNGISQTRYMLHYIPSQKQSLIVMVNAVIWISMATAPLLGGLYLNFTESFSINTDLVVINNYQSLFIICALLFIIPHILRKKLETAEEPPTAVVFALVIRPLKSMFGPFVRIPLAGRNNNKNVSNK